MPIKTSIIKFIVFLYAIFVLSEGLSFLLIISLTYIFISSFINEKKEDSRSVGLPGEITLF